MLKTWRALDLRRRFVLVGAGVLSLVAVLSLAQLATRPAMALLYSGLDPATAGEVVGRLEQLAVVSEVRGDAIYVAEGARDRVRLSLAREGLPRQGQAGYELLDSLSGFSATADMFNAAFWRAKEGELARTILAAPGVRAARVHIAVPSRRPFARESAPPTASVTVTMAGGALTQAQARAMRYLVALSVPNLAPEQVAVIDSRAGIVLAPGSEDGAKDGDTAAAERETRLKAEIEQLIAARVGRDRARVSVTVETDREAETVVETVIDPESQVTLSLDNEELTDTSQGAAGNVTVASNLPAGDAEAGAQRQSARSETRERVNYDYSELRRERVRQAGAIRRISVAVLVDGIVSEGEGGAPVWAARPEEELEVLRGLVRAAIGYDAERGDIVTVESMAFQPDATPGELVEASPVLRFFDRNALTLVQIAVLAAVAVVLGLTVVRPVLTRQPVPEEEMLTVNPDGSPAGNAVALGRPESGALTAAGALAGGLSGSAEADGPASGEVPELSPVENLRLAVAENQEQTLAMLKDWLSSTDEEAA
ncbi:flagellar basal-body MS-ring/collar protein FliF [Paralimibaculum aggregatum]|uniref:Flagellar M-ring protein n=1 Tax=Paralimibaculum aggregatum TaxID=3036245 RepID=A0ABQ6LQW2_9RHOB|nr:flagellar basal-body MS-ring/collar protein FliF [Limibaculum sp. NKW23]GMG83648.1 flagellar basal-body MS-ring/collar protein FliF [Limibaculum sp. NKW23]